VVVKKEHSTSSPTPRVHKCGHPLDPKEDGGFRPAKKSCLACSTAKVEKDKVRAATRREKKKAKIDAALPEVEAGAYRLPDGARFDVSYAASTKTWNGTLTIGTKTFTAEHRAVFKLLRKLDGLARGELGLPVWPRQLWPHQLSDQPGSGDIV
jgi:hypothetical protein